MKVLFVLLWSSVVCAGEYRASTKIVTFTDWSGDRRAEELAEWSTRFAARVSEEWCNGNEVQPFEVEWIDVEDWAGRFYADERRVSVSVRQYDLLPILRHEITHAVIDGRHDNLPRWAREGISAQYDPDWLRHDQREDMQGDPPPAWSGLSEWKQISSLGAYGWAAEIIAFLKTKMTGPEVIDSILSGKFLSYEQDWLNERRSH